MSAGSKSSSDDKPKPDAGPADAGSSEDAEASQEPSSTEQPPKPDTAEHTYVTTTVVLNPEGDTTYISLLPKLDDVTLDHSASIEFAGWASATPVDGKLLMTDGESPTVKRFSLDRGWHLVLQQLGLHGRPDAREEVEKGVRRAHLAGQGRARLELVAHLR